MPQLLDRLDRQFLGNPLDAWLTAATIALAAWLFLYLLKVVVGRRLAALAARTATELDDVASDLLGRTRAYFVLALAVRAGAPALSLPAAAREALSDLTAIAVLLQLGVWGNGIIAFWLRKWSRSRSGDEQSTSATLKAIGVLARGLLWSVVALLALKNVWDFDITALITGLGVGGIAVALAVQNILGDVFAALSIVLDKPFDVGDTIAVDTAVGTVENIGLKTTRVRSVNGEQIIFSNADLLKARVRNLKRMEQRRIVFNIGITYDTPPDLVERVPSMIEAIIEAAPSARFDRAHFARFMDSSLEFEVVYFMTTSDYLAYMNTQQVVNLALLREFEAAGIQFAFPTRTVIHVSADGSAVPGLSQAGGEAAAG
ncbi:MAG: mechanosensitive ion channel family protein [Gemmatimonadaceae bacterium]|nr:mechanosensitive ion channel family protein [Gemmatimonadaceae bacterium]